MAETLSKMSRLRLLVLNDIKFQGCLKYLSNELKYLFWDKYPFMSLPSSFQPAKLVELILTESNIENLWECTKVSKIFVLPFPLFFFKWNNKNANDLVVSPFCELTKKQKKDWMSLLIVSYYWLFTATSTKFEMYGSLTLHKSYQDASFWSGPKS